MRIGYDAKRIFHNFRGLGNYSRIVLESFLKYYPENEYHLYTPPIKDKRALEWQKRFNQVNIHTPEGFLNKNFTPAWRSLFLSKDIKRDDLDLYHGLSHEIPPGLNRLKTKSIVTIHDLIFLRYPDFFPWVDRQVYLKKFSHSCEQADIVVAICEQTKIDLMEFLKVPEDKIRIVYQSCNPAFYSKLEEVEISKLRESYSLSDHYILYVGALEERKNALSLVEAFSRIKDLIPHKLVLVGKGKEYREKIQRCILENGISERVMLMDYIPSEELPAFYQGADLFVYPSHFEGWGIPNVEALYSEVPVITSKGSCFPESAGPDSVFVDPNSVEDIADKMEKVLFDDDLQATMIRQGRQYAENFHMKKTASSMMDVYKDLVISN